jgi:hypothetical protein
MSSPAGDKLAPKLAELTLRTPAQAPAPSAAAASAAPAAETDEERVARIFQRVFDDAAPVRARCAARGERGRVDAAGDGGGRRRGTRDGGGS